MDRPYPDVQAPAEHTGIVLTRTAKLAIGVGVLAGTAIVAGFFTLAVCSTRSRRRRR